jgi:hypothetical protein
MSGKNTCQEVFIGDGVSNNPITIPILPPESAITFKSSLLGLKKSLIFSIQKGSSVISIRKGSPVITYLELCFYFAR